MRNSSKVLRQIWKLRTLLKLAATIVVLCNAALAVQANSGNGKIFATTFRFDAYGADPYATALLDSMVRYVSRSKFSPHLSVQLAAAKP